MSVEEIGCCGTYCGTCHVLAEKMCLSCKLGYRNGERDLSKARCKMKVCCVGKGYNSCADCAEYSSCDTTQWFFAKNGYKYKEALEFIRAHGYDKFLAIADGWGNAYGTNKIYRGLI